MVEKDNLGLAGEYVTASEICRRDYYAQITLGHLKRTDILVYNSSNQKMIKVEVKSKQERWWPNVKGISGDNSLLVLDDFQKKEDGARPDFYILTSQDWQNYLNVNVRGSDDLVELRDTITPVWADKTVGQGVEVKEVVEHKEKWDKLARILD